MAEYFLDTSALAKLYRHELGSDLLDRIAAEADSRRFISRSTILEMESVLALKFRAGEIDENRGHSRAGVWKLTWAVEDCW